MLACVIWPSIALDPRDLQTGATIGNISLGYSDQPNCLVRRDGAWLCTITYNDKPEGSAGEKIVTTISTDFGAKWSPRYDVKCSSMRTAPSFMAKTKVLLSFLAKKRIVSSAVLPQPISPTIARHHTQQSILSTS